MYVVPSTGRSRMTRESGQMRIDIPSEKNMFLTVFLLLWFCAWFCAETAVIFVIAKMIHKGSALVSFDFLFPACWLCCWTIGGAVAAFMWLWGIGGRERITVTPELLRIDRCLFGWAIHREYSVAEAHNFRVSTISTFLMKGRTWHIKGYYAEGPLAFDYGMKTVKFGLAIDEAEARYILRELAEQGFIERRL